MLQSGNNLLDFNVDLDDIFSECYYLDLPTGQPPVAQSGELVVAPPQPSAVHSKTEPTESTPAKRTAEVAGISAATKPSSGSKSTKVASHARSSSSIEETEELTEPQKLERRERNREHASAVD